jgi:hypothetical protein
VPAPGVLANDIDADGDALAAVLVSGPAHRTLTLAADGSFAYVPDGDPGPVGQGDTFTYRTVAAGLSSNVATVSLVGLIAPLFGGVVSGAPVTIDDSSNGKTRPRVSGDLITWSTSFPYEVHYYDLANGQNAVIPRPGDRWHDFSAEIDRGRIAFARLDDVNFISSELVFDVASGQSTDTRAIPEGGPTIGGNTVATTDHNIFGDVNVYAVDLATLRFTFLGPYVFGAPGVLPRVSPAGDAVVWAVTPFQGHSQMFMARRMAGAWSTSSTPDMAGLQFMDADTDGGWTVYTTAPLSDPVTTRIHLRSVGNPSDDRVFDGLPGAQARPSIDRGVISFDGGPGAFADVFVYVIATNTLYQVTDTTDVNETSSDVSVLPNGDIRVTWLEGSSGNVVRALTFTPGIE